MLKIKKSLVWFSFVIAVQILHAEGSPHEQHEAKPLTKAESQMIETRPVADLYNRVAELVYYQGGSCGYLYDHQCFKSLDNLIHDYLLPRYKAPHHRIQPLYQSYLESVFG